MQDCLDRGFPSRGLHTGAVMLPQRLKTTRLCSHMQFLAAPDPRSLCSSGLTCPGLEVCVNDTKELIWKIRNWLMLKLQETRTGWRGAEKLYGFLSAVLHVST